MGTTTELLIVAMLQSWYFLIPEILLHCRLIINIFNNIIWLLFVSNIFKKQLEMLKDINQLN